MTNREWLFTLPDEELAEYLQDTLTRADDNYGGYELYVAVNGKTFDKYSDYKKETVKWLNKEHTVEDIKIYPDD